MNQKIKKAAEPQERFGFQGARELPILFRISRKKYESLARRSYGQPSMQYFVERTLFPKGWESELAELQKQQRKAKIADDKFISNKERIEKGLPPVIGRRSYVLDDVIE